LADSSGFGVGKCNRTSRTEVINRIVISSQSQVVAVGVPE